MTDTTTGRNRATADEAASFVQEYDRLEIQREQELAELDAEFKKKKRDIQKPINAEQSKILDDGKSQGVTKGVVRTLASLSKAKRKAEALIAKGEAKIDALEDDELEFVIDIRKALGDFGDTELGAAAIEADDSGQDETTAAIVEAVESDEREKNDPPKVIDVDDLDAVVAEDA